MTNESNSPASPDSLGDAQIRGLALLAKAKAQVAASEHARAEAFDNTFHKIKAEVSRDWWNRIWNMACAWQRCYTISNRDAGGAASGGQGAVDLQKVLSALEALYLHTKNNMQICGANYCAARAIEELKAAIGPGAISVIEVSIQGAPTPPADVDLPDRVIDQLMHDAGVSLMEPWSEQEMYDFANTVKREVLARLPSRVAAPPPPHPDHIGGEAVAPEAKPEWPKGAFFTDGEGNFYDEQAEPLDHAFAPPAPPAPLPGKEYRTGFDEAPSTFNQEEAAPADYPPHLADEVERELALMIDRCPEPLRRLSDWLANKLDEDDWKTAERLLLGAVESVADRAQRSGVSADPLPLTDTYVQPVPDKCDRITWRGQYYHLPVSSQSQPLVEPTADRKSLNAMAADLLRPYLKEGQKVIWREAFRWQDDNGVLSNHYDGMELEQLADDFGYDWRYDMNFKHAAIVWNKVAASPQHQVKKGELS